MDSVVVIHVVRMIIDVHGRLVTPTASEEATSICGNASSLTHITPAHTKTVTTCLTLFVGTNCYLIIINYLPTTHRVEVSYVL